ncbi:MAG: FepA family TonB-dependent siderophore receptor [Neisseriaceae bacterium]|nr:FepA family TonB-dependent siderophore receptor [Neisseriaceae bacterium]MBP6861032.1 FepA family TonB-dependent siderophore receptor [Neisseriaceae bacterium]
MFNFNHPAHAQPASCGHHHKKKILASAVLTLSLGTLSTLAYAEETEDTAELSTVVVTAERQLKQSLGVSVIDAEEIAKRPPVNDIKDLIRTMPGVNLTGNTASNARGNNRQIDIRGMGPENTLILIDGKPVTARNAVRYSWGGERDTRGDSNWVPVEEIESIEVIRGPAAARYGSGAAGGVVNIITKRVAKEFKGSVNWYTNQPENGKEGSTQRLGFNLSAPIIEDTLSYRLYGNYNKTKGDAEDINPFINGNRQAGREGVENKDVSGKLVWKIDPRQYLTLDANYSRQGNLYAGDTQSGPVHQNAYIYGQETNRTYRNSFSLTHDGAWDWGDTKVIAQYDKTVNSRMQEDMAGRNEGAIQGTGPDDPSITDSVLKTARLSGEASIPFYWGLQNVLTIGGEWSEDRFNDPASTAQSSSIPEVPNNRSSKMNANAWAVFLEDNISLTNTTQVIPGIRFDNHSKSGNNWSPSLNVAQKLGERFTLKGGIAKAYKAPNLYQNAPNYMMMTNGNGCPAGMSGPCYLLGNEDLDPETSVNKEIGIQFAQDRWNASFTWFRNDYDNKIVAGDEIFVTAESGAKILRWENTGKALIEGFEGNLSIPLNKRLLWNNNFTYMRKSEDKTTGNPLSIIPKYTLNSTLDWEISEKFNTLLTVTHYGKQEPKEYATRNADNSNQTGPMAVVSKQDPYTIVGLSAGYKFNKYAQINGGISNLFDKQIVRETSARGEATARTYNESGRAYYMSMKIDF